MATKNTEETIEDTVSVESSATQECNFPVAVRLNGLYNGRSKIKYCGITLSTTKKTIIEDETTFKKLAPIMSHLYVEWNYSK